MLVSKIHYTLEQNLQILNSFVYSNFEQQEINLQFDIIVNRYISSYFRPSVPNSLRGEDEIQKDLDNLTYLKIVDYQIPLTLGIGDLPSNYNYLLNDRSMTTICGVLTEVENRLIGDESLFGTLENPFTKSVPKSPISRVYGDNKIRVYSPGFTVSLVKIDYIRKPISLYDTYQVDPNTDYDYLEFPDNVLELLIDLTRNRLLEMVESKRLEKAIPETNNFNLI